MADLSRRQFAVLAASAAAAPLTQNAGLFAADPITAEQVIDRIRKQIGVEWKPDSVDTLKAGSPSTRITGIATTSMATMQVLQQAVKAGSNFVVSAEPTFFGRADSPTPPARRGGGPAVPDRVFEAKQEFITKNNLVVFRLSDHWKLRRPDPLAQGMAAALGWTRNQSAADPARIEIPPMALRALAAHVKTGLRARGGVRVMGQQNLAVRRIGLLPGSTPIQAALKMLPEVDVIVAGEVREWETVEYVRDYVSTGAPKGIILVGRVVSEEPGMSVCADWLKTLVPEVTVRHISAGDPYWRPV
jgi:putative NIF3 family GTP cyclohydrolase 1 type 2